MQRRDPAHVRAKLLDVWSDALEIPRDSIPLDRNFFTLGGDSILIMRVMDRVNAIFFADSPDDGLPLTDFFAYPTVQELADRLVLNVSAVSLPEAAARQIDSGTIAIIGMGTRVPGAADPETFWQNLREGAEALRFFSDTELIEGGATAEDLADPRYVRCAGLVDDVQCFDAEYFGLTAGEAAIMSPEQRLLLECAQQAMDGAGYGVRWRGERVGVFAGFGLSTYLLDNLASSSRALESAAGMRMLLSNTSPATRISYLLNLTGPSITIDTACSSSLVAVHHACRAVLSGECEMALAGGATVRRFAPRGYRAEQGGIFSPDGHCRPFDREARGTVATSGAGMVLLKRLDAALADGDSIYAVIRGTAVNNDGNTKVGYTAPSASGQAAVIRAACAAAGVEPKTLQYIETHGTATALGDMIEIAALRNALGENGHSFRCALGTLKANVGHLEAAAGVAGLMKAALALSHCEIPPAIHFRDSNPQIDFERTPFFFNRELLPWAPLATPRRAGVSSFGIGGTNAHAVLEEAPASELRRGHRESQLLILSARSAGALQASSRQLAVRLTSEPRVRLSDVAYTLQVGRAAHSARRFSVCESIADAVRSFEAEVDREALPESSVTDGIPVVFMFPGDGSQYSDMARGIFESEPVFREHLDRCAELLRPSLGVDVRTILYPSSSSGNEPRAVDIGGAAANWQPALFAVEYALARLWQSWGVAPVAMIGDGLGEYVAACISGVFSLEDALTLVCARARLHTVLHSGPSDEGLREFARLVERVTLHEPGIPFVSGTTGGIVGQAATARDYWTRQHRSEGGLARGIRRLMQGSQKVFLEIGPGTTLASVAREMSGSTRHTVVSSGRSPVATEKDSSVLMRAVGEVWQAGVTIDWSLFNDRNACHRVALPAYPFERRKHWIERGVERGARPAEAHGTFSRHRVTESSPARSAPISQRDWFYVPAWKQRPAPAGDLTIAARCCVFFDDGSVLCERVAQALARSVRDVVRVREGDAFSEDAGGFILDPTEQSHYPKLMQSLAARGRQVDAIVHAWCLGAPAERTTAVEDAMARGFYALLYLCQALEQQRLGAPLTLTVLTRDAHVILGDERGSPCDTMLSACVRVIGRELPHVACRSIDVSLPEDSALAKPSSLIDLVIGEAFRPLGEPVVAYRGTACFVPTYERLDPTAGAPTGSLLRPGGTYLITGGLGGIGLTLAAFLARATAGRIVLTSRSDFPAREHWDARLSSGAQDDVGARIRKIREIESHGAQVLVARADVTNGDQMRLVVAQTLQRFGALHGVIHAAGVPGAGVIALKDRESAQQVVSPKIEGTLMLRDVVAGLDLDFFLCCSSIASILARPGQFDYSAANAFQDAFAHAHDRRGRTRFISINWDGWKEVGMARSVVARLAGFNHGMSCEDGCEVLRLVLESPRPQWIISMQELGSVLDGSAANRSSPSARARDTGELSTSRHALEHSSGTEEQTLARIWQDVLGVPEPDVDDDFFALGGDSLLAIQLGTQMERCFGVSFTLRQLLQEPTIAGVAKLLRNANTERARTALDTAEPPARPAGDV